MAVLKRHVIAVEGIVQGVGFRPFIYREATARQLRGFVRNDAGGVTIDVEGDEAALAEFVQVVSTRPPPLASISRLDARPAELRAYPRFEIVPSADGDRGPALVSPDLATCDACLRELFDPSDRRFRYPFLNCSDCGPRLTIVRRVPYDRARTTMASFAMCDACAAEYENPADRRFHAQPTACPACGPRLSATGTGRAGDAREGEGEGEEALRAAVAALVEGKVVGIKGLGGYHLGCDATDSAAVSRLRARKAREAKPLAVMVAGMTQARALCHISPEEAALLLSPARPIVLLRQRAGNGVAPEVAPGRPELGVMLPYTPLHHLLLADAGRPLVMTSGNRSDEPIVTDDAEAFERLHGIADLLLAHDRPIETRCDDSVARVARSGPILVRRSRGYAPRPVPLWPEAPAPLLGVGGHLKNTFCLARGGSAFLSHHLGDLENPAAHEALKTGVEHYTRLFGIVPEAVAHDLHPDYLSTRLADALPVDARFPVQHHHAHVAACMAEHRAAGPVLGVAFDGTGLGPDGAIWGGEFLVVEGAGFERAAHLAYVPLPGGAGAVRHPDRMAASHLYSALAGALDDLPIPFEERFADGEWAVLRSMLERGVRSPPTSSVGRLFDAVAALANVCRTARFEGEAAMALEAAVDPAERGSYAFDLREAGDVLVADPGPVVRAVVEDVARGAGRGSIAGRFHNALAGLAVAVARRVRAARGVDTVALTGGTFQNVVLLERAAAALDAAGFRVLLHRQVPCNDGGLAFGQVAVAAARMGG